MAAPRWWCRPSAHRERRRRRADASWLRLSDDPECSPSSGTARSTRSWSSTTISPAYSASTRPASCWIFRHRDQDEGAALDCPAATSRWPSPAPAGAVPGFQIPLSVSGPFDPKEAQPGLTMLMVSTTGEHAAYYVLDEALRPVETEMPRDLQFSVERIQKHRRRYAPCCSWRGAGGSLRAGVTDNPVRRARSVKDAFDEGHQRRRAGLCLAGRRHHLHGRRHADAGGAFGYVPTPALVAPIEFTLKLSDYAALGGHMDYVRPLASIRDNAEIRPMPYIPGRPRTLTRLPQIALWRTAGGCIAGQSNRFDRGGEEEARRGCAPLMTPPRGTSQPAR